jgi:hypothetical protein
MFPTFGGSSLADGHVFCNDAGKFRTGGVGVYHENLVHMAPASRSQQIEDLLKLAESY